MAITALKEAPKESDFARETTTPATLDTPILFAHFPQCEVVLSRDQIALLPGFDKLAPPKENVEKESGDSSDAKTVETDPVVNAEAKDEKGGYEDEAESDEDDEPDILPVPVEEVTLSSLEAWITHQSIYLYSPTHTTGVLLPLTQLTLHALQSGGTGIYLQFSLREPAGPAAEFDDYDDEEPLEITLVPAAVGEGEDRVEGKTLAEEGFEGLSKAVGWLEDAAGGGEEWDEGEEGGWQGTIEGADDILWEGEVQGDGEAVGEVRAGMVRPREGEEEAETKWRRTE